MLWSHHISEQGLKEVYCGNIDQGMFQKTFREGITRPYFYFYESALYILYSDYLR